MAFSHVQVSLSAPGLGRSCCVLASLILTLLPLCGEAQTAPPSPVATTSAVIGKMNANVTPPPELSPSPSPSPHRPQIDWFDRSQEDWSALSDPAQRTDPFDSLKYIPIAEDPQHYLSLGLTVREVLISQSVQLGTLTTDNWLWSRLMLNADLHLGTQVQIFAQVASYFAPGKSPLTPIDQDPLTLEQGFVGFHVPAGKGSIDIRVGRQQVAFDLERFVSDREGPNVLQPFDAVWTQYQTGPWKFQGLYSQPVQTRTQPAFGDSSSSQFTFNGFHIEHGDEAGKVSAFVAQLYDANATDIFTQGVERGNVFERRNVFDLRAAGAKNGSDWDAEGMYQTGDLGAKVVRAWSVGNRYGYTWKTPHWSPRLGIQLDGASGNADPKGATLGTFNPLFPNGYYETMAGYPGYANFWQMKPSVTTPWHSLSMTLADAVLWRQTTADAVYTLPNIPVPNTVGRGISYSGNYQELRVDWAGGPHFIGAFEFEHFINAAWLSKVGAHNGNFAGLTFEFGI
jgi:hypothetical protein